MDTGTGKLSRFSFAILLCILLPYFGLRMALEASESHALPAFIYELSFTMTSLSQLMNIVSVIVMQ